MNHIVYYAEFLTESHSNINELNTLTDELIHIIAKDIANTRRDATEYVIRNPFTYIDIENYHDIRDFIDSYFITSISVSATSDKNNGYYLDGVIELIVYPSTQNLKILSSKDEESLYSLLLSRFSTLLRELQHAYDDFRSLGLYVNHNDTNHKSNYDGGKNKEAYYGSNHELNAYFTDSVSRVIFYDNNLEETPTSQDDGIVLVIRRMRDFDIIKQDFIKKFIGWRYLSDENKKKLLHRLGKYYIIEKEKAQEYNEEKHTKSFY